MLPSPRRCNERYVFCPIAPMRMISYSLRRFVKRDLFLSRPPNSQSRGKRAGDRRRALMATSVAEQIADRLDAMPAGERRAAQTLIANYPLIGLKTVADFSQQAGVSSPTILRFVARLGFQNYPEFQ